MTTEPGNANADSAPSFSTLTRTMAMQALELSLQEWGSLLHNDDEADDDDTGDADDSFDVSVERITCLLVARLVAIAAPWNTYSDLSTSTICRDYLSGDTEWSEYISLETIHELKAFVHKMLSLYHADLPFHNAEHAVHVCVSANKFLEFMLSRDFTSQQQHRPPTFGLRDDPVALAALLFAALMHDVDHCGLTNRQRIKEEPVLALQYNDQSISEHNSLHLAFQELLLPTYSNVYKTLFPTEVDYQRFRMLVIDSVLSTDIASPERTQISKSKWYEAFGVSQQLRQQRLHSSHHGAADAGRRGSMTSQISLHRASKITTPNGEGKMGRMNRRGSNASIGSNVSDVTNDSYHMLKSPTKNNHHPIPTRRFSNGSIDSMGNFSDLANDSVARGTIPKPMLHRRLSSGSDYDSVARRQRRQPTRSPPRGVTKNNSGISYDSMAQYSDFADDSIRLQQKQRSSRRQSAQSYQSHDTYTSSGFKSLAANSIVLTQKRDEGARKTRSGRYHDHAVDNEDLSDNWSGDERPNGRRAIQYDYGGSDHDDDSSGLSLTPPSSDDEDDPVMITGIPRMYANPSRQSDPSPRGPKLTSINLDAASGDLKPRPTAMRGVARRASTGNLPMRFGSLVGSTIDEHQVSEHSHRGIHSTKTPSGPRRMSLNYSSHSSGPVQNLKKRLGIRRSMDLSGEAVEMYPRRASGDMSVRSTFTELKDTKESIDYDEPDDLKAAVVIEILLRASDVAHNLQYFENMTKWMGKMFKELLRASDAGKGFDPRPIWFDNQCRVIESYLMPLASKLNEIGIFGSETGLSFSDILENNLDSWMVEGMDLQEEWNHS